MEKGKKWSKLPIHIKYAASSKSTRSPNRGDKTTSSKKHFAAQSNSTPQGEKPKHRKNSRQGADQSYNDTASIQSTPSSSGRSFNNRQYSHGLQNRNLNPRKGGNFGAFNGGSLPDQVPYFYSYYQPVMAGGVPPMNPGPFIDGEQDPSQAVEIVTMWLRGQM